MKELIEIIELLVNNFAVFFKYFGKALRKPSETEDYCNLNLFTCTILLLLTSALVVPFEFLVAQLQPALIQTNEGWLINLATEMDRNQYTSGKYLIGVFNVLEWMYALFLILIGNLLVAKLFCWRKINNIGALVAIKRMLPSNMVSSVMLTVLSYISFKLSTEEVIPNIAFIALLVPIFLVLVYSVYVVVLKAYRSIFSIGYGKAILIVILGEMAIIPVYVIFPTPVEVYRSALNPNIGAVRANQLISEADIKFENAEYDSALRNALQALELSPRNLSAEFTIISAKTELMSNADPETKSQKKRELIEHLDRLSSEYADLSSVQLYVASKYVQLNECSKARISYRTVENHQKALPFEKIRAIAALNGLEKAEGSNFLEHHKNSIWFPEDSITSIATVVIRTMASTYGAIGLELTINDAFSGFNEETRYSVFPVFNRRTDFINYYVAKACGTGDV